MIKNINFQSQKIKEKNINSYSKKQSIINKASVFYIITAFFLIVYFGFSGASRLFALTSPMTPNTVLDPTCAPTDPNCYVQIYPVQSTSTIGQVLSSDGTNSLWIDGSKFTNSVTGRTSGVVSIGDGGFTGSGIPNFAGSSSGTELAINATSTFSGNLVDFQIGGSSKFKIDSIGNLTLGGNITASSSIFSSLTNGSIVFATSSGVLSQDNTNFFYDSTNHRLGIGTNTPGTSLEVVGDIISKGTNWTTHSTPAGIQWTSVTYGNGLFVAVASNGTVNNEIMTSPDGINWTSRTAPFALLLNSITYGNGLFVAVSGTPTFNNILTSPDGINWTVRNSPTSSVTWNSVTYGNGLFVAVSSSGDNSNEIITSPDGITWTNRTSPGVSARAWTAVTYGNGLFVAVASDGSTSTDIMTSTNGTTWVSSSTSIAANQWHTVTYGNGLFVAGSTDGTNRIMTSKDGLTWTARTTPSGASVSSWFGLTYGNGLFVAVAGLSSSLIDNGIITSPDGITWKSRTSPVANQWRSVAYGNGTFVAVSNNGSTADDVITSGAPDYSTVQNNNLYQGGMSINTSLSLAGYTSSSTIPLFKAIGSPIATTTFGLVSIGDGGFAGSAGNFSGSASGTNIAVNTLSTFSGKLIDLQVGGVSKMNVDGNGNLTVSGPSGSCVLTGGSASSSSIVAGTGAALYCSSDERLKTNIFDLPSALDKINQLRPVEFNWNNDPTGTKSMGFIAQEMQKIYPQFVSVVDPTTGYLGVNYQALVSPIIKSIQEMDLKLEPLTSLDPTKDNSLASLIKKYLSDYMNGIETIFANKIQTKVLCIEDTCITKTQLQQLLNQTNVSPTITTQTVNTNISTDTTSSTPTDTTSNSTSTSDITIPPSSPVTDVPPPETNTDSSASSEQITP